MRKARLSFPRWIAASGLFLFAAAAAAQDIEKRRSPLGSSPTSTVFIGAGIALAALFVILLFLWLKPRRRAGTAPRVRPVGADISKTIRVQPPAAAAHTYAGQTQVFRNLGASLVLETGPDKGREYPLHLMKTLLGRPGGRLNDIEITDGTVSKEQAALHYDTVKKEFTLVNESATNPTLLDGAELSGPTVLRAGAAIEMGKVVLRFKAG